MAAQFFAVAAALAAVVYYFLFAGCDSSLPRAFYGKTNQKGYNTFFEAPSFCLPGEACWPTAAEIRALNDTLVAITKKNPDVSRSLNWAGFEHNAAQLTAIPAGSKNDQPLFGLASNGKVAAELYVTDAADRGKACNWNKDGTGSPVASCNAAVRNNPFFNWTSGFTVFAAVEEQVAVALEFAAKHNLCIAAVSTGHEYNNRQMCPNGLLLRTTLMQKRELVPYPGTPYGALKVGPGNTFESLHKFAFEEHKLDIPSGWCSTVGITGWSLGGGYGPLAGAMGMGVDNTLEFELYQIKRGEGGEKVVTKTIANSRQNADLLLAMKGGGGSVWGVITSLTTKAHKAPPAVTSLNLTARARFDKKGTDWLNKTVIPRFAKWQLSLTTKWASQTIAVLNSFNPFSTFPPHLFPELDIPNAVKDGDKDKMWWGLNPLVIYQGSKDDEEFKRVAGELIDIFTPDFEVEGSDKFLVPNPYVWNATYESFWDYERHLTHPFYIAPFPQPIPGPKDPGSLPEALVPREFVEDGRWANEYFKELYNCPVPGQFGGKNPGKPGGEATCNIVSVIYCSLTGNQGANPSQYAPTSVSPGFRSGLLNHLAFQYSYCEERASIYTLSNWSYYLESSYWIPNWNQRYWTPPVYNRLLETKWTYDPTNSFWCHHCVGDDINQPGGWMPPTP